MNDYTIAAFAINLTYFAVTLAFARGALWWFDRVCGKSFKNDFLPKLMEDPGALGRYLGCRILAVAVLGHAFLGILLLAVVSVAVLPSPASARPLSFDRYDRMIERAVKRHWVAFGGWRWWKAQLYQESRFDPDATSPVGAAGLAQFMSATWAETQRALGWSGLSPRAAGPAIEAGAYYMARLHRSWSAPRPAADRHFLAAASYNAGLGHLLKAQRLCDGPNLYIDIIVCLPQVTGKHSTETITYVERIRRWREQLR